MLLIDACAVQLQEVTANVTKVRQYLLWIAASQFMSLTEEIGGLDVPCSAYIKVTSFSTWMVPVSTSRFPKLWGSIMIMLTTGSTNMLRMPTSKAKSGCSY